MAKVTPFKIDVPQDKIDELNRKLSATILPPELHNSGWDYGSPLSDISGLVKYWNQEFSWRKAEADLNKLPQFMTKIKIEGFDEINLHFVHVKSSKPNAIPLLFCHGWPGTFDEVAKILPILVEGNDGHPAFDVIAPSMPNYGFSSRVLQPKFGTRQTAEVFNKLMTEVLGYPEYVTQGGDVGYMVTRWMGHLYPKTCKASHYNFPLPEEPSETHFPEVAKKYNARPRTKAELAGFERTKWFRKEGQGYSGEHSTKPQTLGYSLTDSPVGLLAWIYEKMHDWTDEYPWTPYEVCKWVSIYWFSTAGPLASLWVYYDSTHTKYEDREFVRTGYLKDIKIGCTKFPKELFVYPAIWNETLGDLVLNKEYDNGGHFAAFERPNELAGDLREMFGKGGGAFDVVSGRSGYSG